MIYEQSRVENHHEEYWIGILNACLGTVVCATGTKCRVDSRLDGWIYEDTVRELDI